MIKINMDIFWLYGLYAWLLFSVIYISLYSLNKIYSLLKKVKK